MVTRPNLGGDSIFSQPRSTRLRHTPLPLRPRAASRITVLLWLGFAIAFTTIHVALQDNLVTVKELLVTMVPSIPWYSLKADFIPHSSFKFIYKLKHILQFPFHI